MSQTDSSNAEQFKQSFREEAREILTDLEAALLELNADHGNTEIIGRIFRGLHTIKGSGAMFGFDELAAFTHHLESAFDLVRNGRLEASAELIDLTLAALDQIAILLDEGTPGAVSPDSGAFSRILSSVRRIAGMEEPGAPITRISEPAPTEQPGVTGEMRTWRIRFAPGPDLMRFGANPLLLVRELRQLGSLQVKVAMDAVPPLEELDPERCYIRWEMELSTVADQEAIRDVFIFVEDTCELSIEPVGDPLGAATDEALARDPEIRARSVDETRSTSPGRRNYDKPENASSLRVPAAKLDQFVDLVGELVTVQAHLSELAARHDDAEMTEVSEEIERLTSALRSSSMDIRMMPIRGTFEKFRRLVHDLARDLGKNVELAIEGAETELDKTVIEQLGDPLMHLIRNSMDHGIEPADLRAAGGKPRAATIRLSARHSGASVLVTVEDDGRGIDSEAVRRRAIERGLISPGEELTESQIFALIFQPGFSTASEVTGVSGRGVGMDVVRQRVESLRGDVEVTSKPGQGTRVTLRLPLTMAIIDGLLVTVGRAWFVLPLASTLECIELTRDDVARANGKHLANVRGKIIPYIRLREHFHIDSSAPEIEQIMLVETAEGRFGFVVDQVVGNCQAVIKSLGRFYRQVQAVSGATILGNGSVALILDPERLIQNVLHPDESSSGGGNLVLSRRRQANSVSFRAFENSGSVGLCSSASVTASG